MRRSLAPLLFRRLGYEIGPSLFRECSSNLPLTILGVFFSLCREIMYFSPISLRSLSSHALPAFQTQLLCVTRALDRSLGSLLNQTPLPRRQSAAAGGGGGGGESSQQARALPLVQLGRRRRPERGDLEKASNETSGFPEGGEREGVNEMRRRGCFMSSCFSMGWGSML